VAGSEDSSGAGHDFRCSVDVDAKQVEIRFFGKAIAVMVLPGGDWDCGVVAAHLVGEFGHPRAA
jgi:hypothetical protein